MLTYNNILVDKEEKNRSLSDVGGTIHSTNVQYSMVLYLIPGQAPMG